MMISEATEKFYIALRDYMKAEKVTPEQGWMQYSVKVQMTPDSLNICDEVLVKIASDGDSTATEIDPNAYRPGKGWRS